jgi:predicted metal-binding membrane protein
MGTAADQGEKMSSFRSLAPQDAGRTALAVCILLIAAGAWLALWLLHSPAQAHPQSLHHYSGGHFATSELAGLLFVMGWALMTVAMMLPTSLPVLTTFHTIAGRRADRWLLLALVISGYLFAWTLFGIVVYYGTVALQWLASRSPWLMEHSWIAAPILLVLAGLFQFTSLKYRCLDKCRSPLSFVIGHWQGRHDRWQAFRLGVDHGVFCVGCCWALMLLMFIVGVGSLIWMMILAIVMGVEKNAPWGRRLSAPLGVALLVSGAAYVVFA